jgi:hypothetical protein
MRARFGLSWTQPFEVGTAVRLLGGSGRRCWSILISFVFLCSCAVWACDAVPAGATLWIRLDTPVSTYNAKPGTPLRAVLENELNCQDDVLFLAGTQLQGQVRAVQRVGWGIRHEVAALQLQFNRLVRESGEPVEIDARVLEVENARETVKHNTIVGIRATETPQGRINSRLKHLPYWNPYTDLGLIAFKALFPIFPEPEIYYPGGTQMRLELVSTIHSSKLAARLTVPDDEFSAEGEGVLEAIAVSAPQRTHTAQGASADLINLVFIGSQQQLEDAFQTAGWVGNDAPSKRAVFREFRAVLNVSTYAHAPMRLMLLNGETPRLTFQKSLNSYAKRDHIRIWNRRKTPLGQLVWAAAATHDRGATLSLRYKRFVHHIDTDVDQERSKVIRDLALSGCVQSAHMVTRPNVQPLITNAVGDHLITDGNLSVVQLKDCATNGVVLPPSEVSFRAGNWLFRYLRKQILTFRSDIWRANIIYGAYDLGRMTVSTLRHHPQTDAPVQALADPIRVTPYRQTSLP